MAETPAQAPKPQPSALRQDLLRGVRWGTILLLVMLLTITGYRLLSSSEATASPAKAAEELTPTPSAPPAAAIQVGEAVLKGPDAPPAPPPVKARKSPAKATAVIPEAPQRLQAPRFAPLPAALAPKPQANAFVAEPLPDPAPAAAPAVDLPVANSVPVPAPAAAPASADNSKQGNRAVRAVRSVGRLFRFGRKDEAAKEEPAKK